MSPSFVEEHAPYFFSQRKDRRFQRRFRKTLDDVSVFGEKRDPLQALRADGESAASVGPPSRPADFTRALSSRRRSSAIGKRVALSDKVTVLPHVDRDGPRLVSGGTEAAETKSVSSESKQKLLTSLPEETEPRSGWTKVKEIYKFDELKFGSTSILSNLGKVLNNSTPFSDLTVFSDKLDPELLRKFLQDYQSLTSDTVVEKREWQTDCYLDLSVKNEQPFLTAPPEEEGGVEEDRKKYEEVISNRHTQHLNPKPASGKIDSEQREREKHSSKRVTMSEEVMSKLKSVERPQTAYSTLSNLSFHSDYSRASSVDDGESRINDSHYDMLPAELRPSIMLYKRESMAPKVKVKGPRTRLEKFRDQMSREHHHNRTKSEGFVLLRGSSSDHCTP